MFICVRISRNFDIMVLLKIVMYIGVDNLKFWVVMLKNVVGFYYIYFMIEKLLVNIDNFFVFVLRGKYDIYFLDGFCCYCLYDMLFLFLYKLFLRIYWIVLKIEKKDVIDIFSIFLFE